MTTIVTVVLAGILATAAMTGLMGFFNQSEERHADIVRAVGSLVTQDETTALGPGLFIHFTMGVLFAFLYIAVMSLAPPNDLGVTISIGLVMGLFHGFAVSFFLILFVSDYHPVPRFRSASLWVGIAHLIGHILYGLVVGLIAALTGARFPKVAELLQAL